MAYECMLVVRALRRDQHGEPVIEQWFRLKTMKHYQIALAERKEIAEALQRSLQMRAERDCFPLISSVPSMAYTQQAPNRRKWKTCLHPATANPDKEYHAQATVGTLVPHGGDPHLD